MIINEWLRHERRLLSFLQYLSSVLLPFRRQALVPELLLGVGNLNLSANIISQIHSIDKSLSGFEGSGGFDQSVKFFSIFLNNLLEFFADLIIINDVLVEVIEPSKFLIQSFRDLSSSFQVSNLSCELNLCVVISKNLNKNISQDE